MNSRTDAMVVDNVDRMDRNMHEQTDRKPDPSIA